MVDNKVCLRNNTNRGKCKHRVCREEKKETRIHLSNHIHLQKTWVELEPLTLHTVRSPSHIKNNQNK